MANTWPKTGAGTLASGYLASGVTTISWGTEGVLQSPKPASGGSGFYTVTRVNQKPIVDKILLNNGNGIPTTRILIVSGATFSVTVRDDTRDSNELALKIGDTAVLTDMAGQILAGGTTAAVGNIFTCTVVDTDYDTAEKQPGERVLICENLILIDSQTAGTAA